MEEIKSAVLSLMCVENVALRYRRSEITALCVFYFQSCHLAVNVLFRPAQMLLASTIQSTGVFVTRCHLCRWYEAAAIGGHLIWNTKQFFSALNFRL